MTEKTTLKLVEELVENLKSEIPDEDNLGDIVTEILNRQEGKETFFNLFENGVIENNQKDILLTSLSNKNKTAVYNSISVEQRIAFLENLNDGDVCASLP